MQNNQNLEGAFLAYKKNGECYYRSSLTHKRKHVSLGSYPTAELAHDAYVEGHRILNDLHCSITEYNRTSILPFDKWVCLINFRDNGIYFSNPIYLSKRMFYYYLTPSKVFRFDMDDLFYYSSHKIMQRGNHYFVADYGMQVSIASRYGIMPYAREGKDYSFINGDSLDYRRENIEIQNAFRGVSIQQKNGQPVYTVRIHVNGNIIVGHYKDQFLAAIAYNKAIDILKKNGINKNYVPNYLEGMSPSNYANLYSSVKISNKIYACKPTSQNNQSC